MRQRGQRGVTRGFTLIELLTAISVIGVLTAVSWPTLGKVQRREQVRQGAEQLANLLRDAQERTLSEQHIYGVLIDPVTDSAALIYYGESYEGQTTYDTLETVTLDPTKVDLDATTIVDGDTGLPIVRYSRAGLPSVTGTTTLTAAAGSDEWQVTVIPAGSITVARP